MKKYSFTHEELKNFESAIKGLSISRPGCKWVFIIDSFKSGDNSVANDYKSGAGNLSVYVNMRVKTLQTFKKESYILHFSKKHVNELKNAKHGMFELKFDETCNAAIVPVNVGAQVLNSI